MDYQPFFQQLYQDFNTRNSAAVLAQMQADVQWPKAFEGGYVTGPDEVQHYWTRQWAEIDAHVEPVQVLERPDGTVAVTVHQVVNDRQGTLLFDGLVQHIYTLRGGLIQRMDVEPV